MGIKSIVLFVLTLVLSAGANAALIERLGGLAYYDDVADLTWLANATAGAGSTFDDGFSPTDGVMTWQSANDWAAQLTVSGVGGWRLADTLQPDASCHIQNGGVVSEGLSCTGSELGNLFYNVLGGTANTSIVTVHNANYDLFSNIQTNRFWSATEFGPSTGDAWLFLMGNGAQIHTTKTDTYNAWAVQSGDIGAVPVPAAVWLFGSGLIGLIGIARRKKS